MDYFPLHKKLLLNINQAAHFFDLLIPFHGFHDELLRELKLKSVTILIDTPRAILTDNSDSTFVWAQDTWKKCKIFNCEQSVENKNEKLAVSFLKQQPNFGIYHQIEVNKIADRILKKIKSLTVKRINYQPSHPFDFKFYAWSIISDFLIFSDQPTQRFPLGWHEFNEDKLTPPNRAYLKLWELFGVHNLNLKDKPEVLEIGASPGGWSWVLSQHASVVHTVDRAPLDIKLKNISQIRHKTGDAFKLKPEDYPNCTWLFSDLICTPEKMYETVCFWLEQGQIKNFVCTIKFKGNCDFEILKKFQAFPNSKIIHLYQNKNEVTWIMQHE
jgi:23S rRNA (cytidine2498-2'-O)-methyltransferase